MKALVWATIDTLSCLLLVVLAAINPPVQEAHSAVETHGRWVVMATWVGENDVDLWMQTADGRKVWFLNMRTRLAHLEQDDRGFVDDDAHVNHERIVIRSIEPGEYIANVHCYACYTPSTRVRVELWRLQGADRLVRSRTVTLRYDGHEATAFRFSLDRAGVLTDTNELPAQLVGYE